MSSVKSNFTINYIELKYRIIYLLYAAIFIFCVLFFYRVELFFLISNLFLQYEAGFIYTSLLDPLIVYFKLSFLYLFVIIFPVGTYLIGSFLFKSFCSFQLRYLFIYVFSLYFISLFLFILISKVFLPIILEFLINFQRLDVNALLELKLQATIIQYYSFFFTYLLIYLTLILIPNIFLVLVLFNIISNQTFLKHTYRKYLYLLVFIVFILIAPPDFFLQLFLAPFLVLFLEIYIFYITFFHKLYNCYS